MTQTKSQNNKKRGIILLNVIVFGLIGSAIVLAITGWFAVNYKVSKRVLDKEVTFHIAEAGIEYYRWHLAHAPTDYTNGTGEEGPYTVDFNNKDGEKIGEFELMITPPSNGSTVVTVQSKGTLLSASSTKTIRAKLAKPSFAKYAFAANDEMRFGEGTEVFGPIHSNDGIRFDGLAHNLISSSLETYDDPDHSGPLEWAVHTHVSPTDPFPPTNFSDRTDVFEAGRQVGAPAVDFDGITADLASLKALAQEPEGLYFNDSGRRGYLLQLQTDDTFDLYQVRSLHGVDRYCYDSGQDGWGSWSVRRTRFLGNYDFPDNGVIFLEDDIWVEGTIDGARLTIVAARFPDSPSTRRSITINNDLKYTNTEGVDSIALIAQKNINTGMRSENNLEIDAALVAQKGRVGRYYYNWGCSPYDERNQIDLYGMIATNDRYGFAYTDGSGYETRNITYDANLLYGPPPEFPLTSDQYEIISWEEVD